MRSGTSPLAMLALFASSLNTAGAAAIGRSLSEAAPAVVKPSPSPPPPPPSPRPPPPDLAAILAHDAEVLEAGFLSIFAKLKVTLGFEKTMPTLYFLAGLLLCIVLLAITAMGVAQAVKGGDDVDPEGASSTLLDGSAARSDATEAGSAGKGGKSASGGATVTLSTPASTSGSPKKDSSPKSRNPLASAGRAISSKFTGLFSGRSKTPSPTK
jgi:hypothetical protein